MSAHLTDAEADKLAEHYPEMIRGGSYAQAVISCRNIAKAAYEAGRLAVIQEMCREEAAKARAQLSHPATEPIRLATAIFEATHQPQVSK